MTKLLSVSSAKLDKSQNDAWLNAVMYLEPSMNYKAICSHSSHGCRQSCLVHSGRMPMQNAVNARVNRTTLYLEQPSVFFYLLESEINALIVKADKQGKKLAIRLNGTSDIDFSEVYAKYSGLQFYEYTKNSKLACKLQAMDNVHVTLSAHEKTTDDQIRASLLNGINVTVVFKDAIPSKYNGIDVINGDDHDRRFEDETGRIVGLKLKGNNEAKALAVATGFAR